VRLLAVGALFLALGAYGGERAKPASDVSRTWAETKCVRYSAAWRTLVARRGTAGLSADFLARHDAFLTGGCAGEIGVCPRSKAELDVANAMIVAAMNAGTASTFPPFRCTR
jgi:hypothetical protein